MSNFLRLVLLSLTTLVSGCVVVFPQKYEGPLPDCLKIPSFLNAQPSWPYARMIFSAADKQITMNLHSEVREKEIVVVGFTELGNRGLLFKEKNASITSEVHPMYQKIIDPAFIASAFSVANKLTDSKDSISCGSLIYKIDRSESNNQLRRMIIVQKSGLSEIVLEP